MTQLFERTFESPLRIGWCCQVACLLIRHLGILFCNRGGFFNSWCLCSGCGVMQTRKLTPQTLESDMSPYVSPSQCWNCKSKSPCAAPAITDVPEPLRGLFREVAQALSPFVDDCGAFLCAKDKRGLASGYRVHNSMMRFAWHESSRLNSYPS